ncbi:MAG TPA: hypothetical protein V6D06_18320 [Trichocoleus sp.]
MSEQPTLSVSAPAHGACITYQGVQMQVYYVSSNFIWLMEPGATRALPYPWPEPEIGPQVLETPVIKPQSFQFGARVVITQKIQGRDRPNPEDKKKPFPVWFTPWAGCEGIYCGLSPVGLALVDFGVPGLLYPISPEKLEEVD